MNKRQQAVLALADGKIFEGVGFGHQNTVDTPAVGEVVFNTSLYGYQEILTDPSYYGQLMTFTYPHIGNVGWNDQDYESDRVQAAGVISRNFPTASSNYRAKYDFDDYLRTVGITGIAELDTRELVLHLRENGSQMGAVAFCSKDADRDDLVSHAKSAGTMEGKDYVSKVSCESPYSWNELPWDLERNGFPTLPNNKQWSRPHLVAIDCGVKRNILRLLLEAGFRVTVMPASSSKDEILGQKPDALFLSNGPGDPATQQSLVKTVSTLVGKFPIFGICLGHQVLAQVFGAKTYKLKFGHRGGNHPVMNMQTREVEITVQNHGFAVDKESLTNEMELSHLNLNDDTVEGFVVPGKGVLSIQYHPESSPGPHDALYLFKQFFESTVSYSAR